MKLIIKNDFGFNDNAVNAPIINGISVVGYIGKVNKKELTVYFEDDFFKPEWISKYDKLSSIQINSR